MLDTDNYLSQAKAYWRYAPGGEGKIDTAALHLIPDAEFLERWDRSKRVRRQNLWEEKHFIAHFSKMFVDKKVLSFGCGLAYSETDFLDRGAHITFADIVASNVDSVRRLCRLRGYEDTAYLVLSGDPAEPLGGDYDFVFAYGSLMHMPEDSQRQVLHQFARSLRPGGRIVLMLYTPQFVKSTGSTPDPREFALKTDPSVGEAHNPWSDWHDDEKLRRLAPDFLIVNKQTFHEDRFVWYALAKQGEVEPSLDPFLDLGATEENGKLIEYQVPLENFVVIDAAARQVANNELLVVTEESAYHYAIKFPEVDRLRGTTLAFEIDIIRGGASIGLLDVTSDRFVASKSVSAQGNHTYYLELPALPDRVQVVVSNFQPGEPASSSFIIKNIRFMTCSDLAGR